MENTSKRGNGNAVWTFLAILIAALPLPWIFASICAAIVHEAGHYIAILLLTGERTQLFIQLFHSRLRMPDSSCKNELICAMSGPAAGIMLLLLQPVFPKLAFCALVQSAFNLLPIYPLDGGRTLQCLLAMICKPDRAAQIYAIIANLCRFLVVIGAFYATVRYDWGYYALFAAGIVLIPRK